MPSHRATAFVGRSRVHRDWWCPLSQVVSVCALELAHFEPECREVKQHTLPRKSEHCSKKSARSCCGRSAAKCGPSNRSLLDALYTWLVSKLAQLPRKS